MFSSLTACQALGSYIQLLQRDSSNRLEHSFHTRTRVGSIPTPSTKLCIEQLLQFSWQNIPGRSGYVEGSNPSSRQSQYMITQLNAGSIPVSGRPQGSLNGKGRGCGAKVGHRKTDYKIQSWPCYLPVTSGTTKKRRIPQQEGFPLYMKCAQRLSLAT